MYKNTFLFLSVFLAFAYSENQSVRIGLGSASAIKYSILYHEFEARIGSNFDFTQLSLDFGDEIKTTTSTWNFELGYVTSFSSVSVIPYFGYKYGIILSDYSPSPNDVSHRESEDKYFDSGLSFGIESIYKISSIGIGASLEITGYNYRVQRNQTSTSIAGASPEKTAFRNVTETFYMGVTPGIFIGYWF